MRRPIGGVSVVIPTLNAMPYIKDAIESILRQTYQRYEIIIVDGGSEDGTVEFVKQLASSDSRIRVVPQESGGIGEARNVGIRVAKYDWIACMDADDISYPRRLELQIEFLNKNTEMVFVSCDTDYIDINGNPVGLKKRHKLANPPNYDPYIDGNVPHQGAMFSKTAVLSVGGYRDFPQGEDYDLFLRLSEHYRLGFMPEILVSSRILKSGLTLKGFETQRIYWMYAKDCAKARRSGVSEPAFEDWLKSNEDRIQRKRRKWQGERFWTLAGAYITERRWALALWFALGAFLLNPKYVLHKARTYALWR